MQSNSFEGEKESGYGPLALESLYAPINRQATFPEKLYYIVDEAERAGISEIVSWQPHGELYCALSPFKLRNDTGPSQRYFPIFSTFLQQEKAFVFMTGKRLKPSS
jgi:hypothetical protein